MKSLEGLRVLALTQAMAAPYGTMTLADRGADVIKVEPPGGEEQRRASTSRNGHSGSFMAINRNKRGITLDLKMPEGVEEMHRLIRAGDVFVPDYRPGPAGPLGRGPAPPPPPKPPPLSGAGPALRTPGTC